MKKTLITLLALSGIAMGATVTIAELWDFAPADVTVGTKTAYTNTTASGITMTVSSEKNWFAYTGEEASKNAWDTGYSTGNITGLNTLMGGLDIEGTAEDYIAIGEQGTLTMTITGLTAGNTYNIAFITGGAETKSGAWDTITSPNETTTLTYIGNANATGWGVSAVQRWQPTGIYAELVANENGAISLSVTGTSYHNVTANGFAITGEVVKADPTPGDNVPEPTTATLSLLALCGLAARRRRK